MKFLLLAGCLYLTCLHLSDAETTTTDSTATNPPKAGSKASPSKAAAKAAAAAEEGPGSGAMGGDDDEGEISLPKSGGRVPTDANGEKVMNNNCQVSN